MGPTYLRARGHRVILLAAALCAGNASAVDYTWTGGAYVSGNEATRYWDLAGNWSPSGVPGAGQSAVVNIAGAYAVVDADLAGSPAIEVSAGGMVGHKNGVTLTTPVTLSGGTWHLCPNLNYYGWGPDRVLNAALTVTAPSFMKGGRGNNMRVNGALSGGGLLTFQGTDQYLGDGPDWSFYVANSTFSGGMVIDTGNYPVVWAMASQALGTGDITVRSTGTLFFGANQDYSGALRTPVLYLEGGATGMSDHFANGTIPFNVVVQSTGGTLGAGTWSSNNTYSGSVTLNGPLTLAGSRGNGGSTNFTITGAISGNYPVTVNTTDYYQTGRGIVTLANASNNFASLTLQRGYLKVTGEGALSAGSVTLYTSDSMTRLYLDKTPDADWMIANNLAGTGTIQVEAGTGRTLTTSGAISPGIGADNTGTVTIEGNLGFAAGAALAIDLNGVDPLSPTSDCVTVSGSVSNLANATLNIAVTGDISAIAGRLFTIVTCANDLTGQSFGGVVVPDGYDKAIVYGNGTIKVAVSPHSASDTIPPAAVIDLAAGNAALHSLTLTWTAPGDDGVIGTAASYDIRWSTSTITDANWGSATPVTGLPVPTVAGTGQSVVVAGLSPATMYYFAMKTADEVPNVSALSNVASGQTLIPDTTPPAAVTDLAVRTPTSTTVTLTWTAPGDDGNIGTATSYDIRYSTSTITDANWAGATPVPGLPTPTAAGTVQSVLVSGLHPSTTYYFAMKSADEIPNTSALSNVAIGSTAAFGPADKPVLSQSDFTYSGYYLVPTGGNFSGLNWGQGFTHRYVNGQLRFLTFSFYGNYTGGGYQLIEFAPPANLGGVATFTNHWADIWPGTGLNSGGVWMGLWFEQAKNRLWTTWAIDYPDDTQSSYTKSLAIRTLNDDGTVSNGIGPWGLAGVQQRRIYGGVTALPPWFQDFYQVGPYAVGWGGYASRMGLGVSLGPTFYAIPEPTGYPAGDIPTSDFRTVMDHSGGTTSTDWYASGHPVSFDRGVRNSNVKNDYDAPAWQSPAPDGLGRWVWGDSAWNTGAWIETPSRQGFVLVPKLSSGRAWYQTSTLHCRAPDGRDPGLRPQDAGRGGPGDPRELEYLSIQPMGDHRRRRTLGPDVRHRRQRSVRRAGRGGLRLDQPAAVRVLSGGHEFEFLHPGLRCRPAGRRRERRQPRGRGGPAIPGGRLRRDRRRSRLQHRLRFQLRRQHRRDRPADDDRQLREVAACYRVQLRDLSTRDRKTAVSGSVGLLLLP